jgi:hypothetical protein
MPSLYESTAVVGDVASSNFTTLYNSSNLTVPNAGAGSVSGNLNVSGNLTVQGTSLLVGAVTLGSTLSLPNYTFPSTDGSTDQVLTTDGSGNLYFTSVSALGASYTIQADTATGGSNLTLVSSGGVLDSVKMAAGSGMSIVRTDANTITFSTAGSFNYEIRADATTGGANLTLLNNSTPVDSVKFAAGANMSVVQTDANTITLSGLVGPLPSGNQGNILYNDGSNWVASSDIEFANSSYRLAFINNIASGTSVTAAEFLKKQATLDNNDSSAIGFGQIVGSTKTFTHRLLSTYDANGADNIFRIQADPTGTFTGSEYAQLFVDNDQLGIFGSELKFLRSHTGAPTQNASIIVERGTSTDATFIWDETNDRWSVSNGLNVDGNLRVTGLNAYINATSIASSSNLYLKGDGTTPLTDKYIQWDEAQQRFFINEDTRIDGGLILQGDYIILNADNTALLNSTIRGDGAGTGAIRWNNNLPSPSFWEFTNNGGVDYYPFVINIDDLNDVVITPPTAAGQFLYNDGTNWVNSSTVTSTANANRAVFEFKPATPTTAASALFARKNTGGTAYTAGDLTGIGFSVDSDSQAVAVMGFAGAVYDATTPTITLRTSTDNFVANSVEVANFSSSNADIAAPTLTLDADNTGAGVDQFIVANRGSTGTDVNIKWNEATDRWQTTTDGTNYLNIPNQNLDTTSDVAFGAVAIDGLSTYNTQTTNTAATTTVSISSTTRITQKVIINIIDNVSGEFHALEALAFRKGTTAYLTTYAEMYTASALATFTADVSGGAIRILATPTTTNSTTFTVARISLD